MPPPVGHGPRLPVKLMEGGPVLETKQKLESRRETAIIAALAHDRSRASGCEPRGLLIHSIRSIGGDWAR
jgi:hypothetical protein